MGGKILNNDGRDGLELPDIALGWWFYGLEKRFIHVYTPFACVVLGFLVLGEDTHLSVLEMGLLRNRSCVFTSTPQLPMNCPSTLYISVLPPHNFSGLLSAFSRWFYHCRATG